jgi:hypothetical protein
MKVINLLVVVTHFWAPNKHVKNKKRKYKKLKKILKKIRNISVRRTWRMPRNFQRLVEEDQNTQD